MAGARWWTAATTEAAQSARVPCCTGDDGAGRRPGRTGGALQGDTPRLGDAGVRDVENTFVLALTDGRAKRAAHG